MGNAQRLIAEGAKSQYPNEEKKNQIAQFIHQVSQNYETLLFYALREENWDLLKQWSRDIPLKIGDNDFATRKLLVNRAMSGDYNFFKQLFQIPLDWNDYKRTVLAYAIKHDHIWFCQYWPNIDLTAV